MKHIGLILLSLLLSIALYASTIEWRLYTNNRRHSISLKKTIWISETDGQKIYFNKEDGEGVFDNGIEFDYYPPVMQSGNMTATPDQPTEMHLYLNGKKINTIRLGFIEGRYFLVDKRNIKYHKK